jgi:uncharacterized protein (TIGR00255 family)
MTGFASKTLQLPLDNQSKVNVSMSVKTLNSRFFETTCKLPYTLSNFETEFTKILKQRLSRGHVYLTIHMSSQNLIEGMIEPSLPTIKGYLHAIEVMKKTFELPGTVTINDLLQLPNIFNVEEKTINEQAIKFLFTTFNEIIDSVIATRQKEGEALTVDLKKRASIMQREIDEINTTSLVLMEAQKQKVADLIKELESNENEQVDTRKQALYYALDKMDIHEEVVRFKSHLTNLHAQLESAEVEKGKRLDFTLQELAREINTITAKCSDVPISSLAINVKVELEKMREQVQNIV